jgi:1A family penicillin-binding protein
MKRQPANCQSATPGSAAKKPLPVKRVFEGEEPLSSRTTAASSSKSVWWRRLLRRSPQSSKTETPPARSWKSFFQRKKTQQHEATLKSRPARKPALAWLMHKPWLRRFLLVVFFPIINPFARYATLAVFLTGVVGIIYIMRDVPSPTRLTSRENYPVSTQIFDRNNKLLYEIFAEENRTPIELSELPPHVYQASIAIEDKSFYSHWGFDIRGIIRALITNAQGESTVGGSTITQQLVKNALLTPEKSLKRKVKEGVLSVVTEILYTKDEILEMYLNYISYGGTSVGIESAARSYFDKSAKDLTLGEAALLAGLPQAPSRYSPFGSNPQAAKDRQAEVLRRMVEDGYITEEQAETAKQETLKYALKKTDIQAPHFVFYVRDLLYEKYGEDRVKRAGFRVHTTLDLDLQNVAQASLSAEVESLKRARVGNGAALILKPNTGEILAMIGSKDYFNTAEDGQVNVTLAQRQPGSSIKPIMYAIAFQEKLLNPGSVLLDIPTCFSVPGQKPYCPKNYDGGFRGPITIRGALANSLNIPAVKGLKIIGLETFINYATSMGITSWKDPSNYGLSLTLGGGEVRMIDLAQAFTVIANQGVKVPLTPILKIEDYEGNLIEETNLDQRKENLKFLTEYEDESEKDDLQRVMDRAPAYLTAHIMQDNFARTPTFGARSKLVIDGQVVSAKTGTTNDLKDNWTVGFTPEFLVITWVGNNDGRPMGGLASGITGAAPIFHDLMSYVLKGREPVLPEKPADVTAAQVCISGMPPQKGEQCQTQSQELYWKLSRPSATRSVTKEIWVRPETGLPPNPGEPTDGLVLQSKNVIEDPVTREYCADCARPVDDQGRIIYEQRTITEPATPPGESP